MKLNSTTYHGYRFPPEIISHSVWLYHRARALKDWNAAVAA